MKNLIFYINMTRIEEMNQCNCKIFNSNFEFQHDNRSLVSITDKGSSTEYRYNNKESDHLAKYRIDGGLITEGVKCDYLLLNCEKKHSIFIEIKGSDLIHAVEQIDRSIDLLKTKMTDFSFFARIVLTRVNTTDLKNTSLLKLEKKMKSLNGNLIKKNKILEDINS